MLLSAFDRQDGRSFLMSTTRFMPLLKHDEVPEHPGSVGFRLPMAAHQVLNNGNVKDALVADPLFG